MPTAVFMSKKTVGNIGFASILIILAIFIWSILATKKRVDTKVDAISDKVSQKIDAGSDRIGKDYLAGKEKIKSLSNKVKEWKDARSKETKE